MASNEMNDKKESLLKESISSTLKAMAKSKETEVAFDQSTLAPPFISLTHLDKALAHLPSDINSMDDIRGAADLQALFILNHDQDIYKRNLPSDYDAVSVLSALERARCEAIGAREYKGVQKNLDHALLSATEEGMSNHLSTAIYAMARKSFISSPLPEPLETILDEHRAWIDARVNAKDLEQLLSSLDNQQAFSRNSLDILNKLEYDVDLGDTDPDTEENSDSEDNANPNEQEQDKKDEQSSDDGTQDDTAIDDDFDEVDDNLDDTSDIGEQDASDSDEQSSDDSYGDGPANEETSSSKKDGLQTTYKIYTTQFDEIVKAEDLADTYELDRLRELLDQQLTGFQTIISKLANRLQRKLLSKQQRSWKFDLDEGVLDSGRLARIVANPSIPLSFKQEQDIPFKDTVVTILLDNSGSMRGRPITISALCADILSRTLERCQIKVEVLGFTTRTWKGGKSREFWQDKGRQPTPGRLNDLRHIIYKSADLPYRRTRKNLGLMLKEGLLKENIDGEALVWAHERLHKRPEERKILIVISDGAPVDDSTLSVNPSNILERDLNSVVHWLEKYSNIELSAIGIGHDVTRIYKDSIVINDANDLGEALVNQLDSIFKE